MAVRGRPDAIVLDVLMPGMDGWETCRLRNAILAALNRPFES